MENLIFDIVSTYELMYKDYKENYLTIVIFAINYKIKQRHARHVIDTGKLIEKKLFNLN